MSEWYVGLCFGQPIAFKSDFQPTPLTHGDSFIAVVGPFKTKRAAIWAASPAAINNPHYQCVADAERISKQDKEEQSKMEDFQWRYLDKEETEEFRQWARDNYKIGDKVDPVWHPVVREECEKIRKEAK